MENIIINDDLTKSTRYKIIKKSIKDSELEICFSYSSDFSNTKKIRDFIEDICDIIWIKWNWKSRIILIADEMNNNAIEHWSKEGDYNHMRFKCNIKGNLLDLNIEVEDTWNWISPKKAFHMKKIEKDKLSQWFNKYNSIRWRWLFLIIYKLVDELYYKDSKDWGLVVWIRKKIDLPK